MIDHYRTNFTTSACGGDNINSSYDSYSSYSSSSSNSSYSANT